MKILYLPLKKKWYEMIERGEKLEEYREIGRHWVNRLCSDKAFEGCVCTDFICKDFDAVCFSYGYTKRRMLWECKGVDVGQGRIEWGAPNHDTFIIKLGKRLTQYT